MAMTDKELLDNLEAFVNTHGGLFIHNGTVDTKGQLGLGLGFRTYQRTLRQALEQLSVNFKKPRTAARKVTKRRKAEEKAR